ncbi:PREDICTED: protein lin-41-like [Branchiostoma belcheri]|uniref:Protein lin-41-like n=1 Tax=Branchiostoma belcheri TaxID=7741 RepID=A0A6P4XLR9_BRABE|nr:PREDICTED: protein lin-41-like [Branchiostoma belcheri]
MKGGFLRSFSLGNMEPSAVCMGHNDTLWVVLDRGSKFDIRQYSKEGHDLAKFTCSIKYKMVYGIAWHKLSDRIILTLAILGHRQDPVKVAWFSPTYTQESATCNVSTFGSEGGRFPQLVTVDQKGNIFVADHSNSRILKYDKNGVYLSSFGSKGRKPGNLYNPSGICVDSLGRVIVADFWNSQLEMFTAEGEHIHTIAYIKLPMQVATGGEGQLVVSNRYGFVTIFPKY